MRGCRGLRYCTLRVEARNREKLSLRSGSCAKIVQVKKSSKLMQQSARSALHRSAPPQSLREIVVLA